MNHAVVELHAATAAPDAWVGGGADFEERWAAHAHADEVVTRVERANVRELLALARALRSRRWRLVVWREGVRACRIGMAAPRVLRAAARAEERGLEVRIEGLPHCVMGPYARLAEPGENTEAPPPVCAGCSAVARCARPGAAYLARYGDAEFRALP